jgi:hypothetical protein
MSYPILPYILDLRDKLINVNIFNVFNTLDRSSNTNNNASFADHNLFMELYNQLLCDINLQSRQNSLIFPIIKKSNKNCVDTMIQIEIYSYYLHSSDKYGDKICNDKRTIKFYKTMKFNEHSKIYYYESSDKQFKINKINETFSIMGNFLLLNDELKNNLEMDFSHFPKKTKNRGNLI